MLNYGNTRFRFAYHSLLEWKNSKYRKPLLIRGARQVGKTTLVRQFSHEFGQFIELNLEKDDVEKYSRNDTDRKIIRHIIETAPYETDRIKFEGFGNSNYRS
ncbi:MAG: AAA family ATPase [Fulvivirga sp.]